MWRICTKECRQFFSSLTGYIAIIAFLLLNGLFLFVFPETSILDYGYATLDGYFSIAPWIFLILIPMITMRSLAEEYKSGTFELLKTLPLSPAQIVWGKFMGATLIVLLSLLPTIIYAISIQMLSSTGGIDTGSTIGSYIGLLLIGCVFAAIGICTSSFTSNIVVAFISGVILSLLLYKGFDSIGSLLSSDSDYYIQMFGLNFHYKNISKGVVDIRDILYFLGIIYLCLLVSKRNVILK
jgi:ABC-2 type transport system permease protein